MMMYLIKIAVFEWLHFPQQALLLKLRSALSLLLTFE